MNSIKFKYDFLSLIEMDSDNDYFDLYGLSFFFKFISPRNKKKTNRIFLKFFTYTFTNKLKITFDLILLLDIFKTNRALYTRPYLFKGQLITVIKKLKKVRFKRKRMFKRFKGRRSALKFFQKKYFYSFIKLRWRIFKGLKKKKRKKRFKNRIKSKVYKVLLNRLKKQWRSELITATFLFLKKKKLFFENNKKLSFFLKNKLAFYNLNLIPFSSFSKEKQFLLYKNMNVLKSKLFSKLFIPYTSSFFEKLTNQKFFFKLYTNPKISKFEAFLVNYTAKKYFYLEKQFKGVFHIKEFIYILVLTFKQKDLFFLRNWLINFLEKINLKKHKAFLKGFKRVLLLLLTLSSKLFKVSGFLFDIRGKVGVSGNAKKRHLAIRYKSYGFTKIKLRAEQVKFVVRTNTGVLGATMILTY